MVDLTSPIVKEFLIESFDNLESINNELTQFENNSHDKELLNAIFRKVHTLKGSASFLGLKLLQNITHHSENILDLLREDKITISSQMIDALLESFDACITILKSIENSGEEGSDNFEELINKLKNVLENDEKETPKDISVEKSEENSHKTLPDDFENDFVMKDDSHLIVNDNSLEFIDSLDIEEAKNNISSIKEDNTPTKVSEDVEVGTEAVNVDHGDGVGSLEDELKNLLTIDSVKNVVENEESTQETNIDKKIDKKIDKSQVFEKYKNRNKVEKTTSTDTVKTSGSVVDSVVRVNVSLLDKIMNVVGELVLNRNQILQYANLDSSSELSRLAHSLNSITTELQTDIMTTRMQPVGSVLSKFERVVRDLAKEQGKSIKLNIQGKETELDKTLLEAIRDPLTHLIRNAVDHGIEKPAERAQAQKSETARLSIKSYHEGGQVTIEISDDGKGIDPDVILKKAIEKNIVKGDGAGLSKKQIINLIFSPGFSTAAQVTNISGRGVGMDVVRSNIEKIGGTVEVNSFVGEGTTFKLKIPLTLAIVPALVVQSSGETFAIPQVNLMELVRIEENDDKKIELIHNSEFFRLRGDLIPVFRLNSCLKFTDIDESKEDLNIVILKAEGFTYGLVVDSVLDTEEIVVKPLSRNLKDINVFGGATIMGDGAVSLIIDGLGFYNYMSGVQQRKTVDAQELVSEINTGPAYNDEVLLCKLADKRTYGIPLSIVHRLEEFKLSEVEWSGQQPLVRYRNRAMPLINIERSLSLNAESCLLSKDKKAELPVVVVNAREVQVGFVVDEISDIAINRDAISVETIDRDGFLGTAFINDLSITILDIFSILDQQSFVKNLKGQRNGNILIVEDSELFLKVQEESFKDAGFNVITAKDGKDGLSKVSEDLLAIVTDIEMPVMDGWEFIKSVRSSGNDIPMIAISTVSNKRHEELLKAGFDLCFDKQNAKKAIEAIIDLKRAL